MKGKINFKAKGETNVEDGETILRRTNIIDMNAAKVKHAGRSNWDDFEAFASSNEKEGEYVATSKKGVELEKALARVRGSHVGRKILSLKSLRLAA